MTGPPTRRQRVQLNVGVLLDLHFDETFGELLEKVGAETACLFGLGLCLSPDGRVGEGTEV